jgi:hypothetical protein
MAANIYEPAESELREALGKVQQRLGILHHWTDQWLNRLDDADETVFRLDREAWAAVYADVPSAVPRAMRDRLELLDEQGGLDDDGNTIPPSPRWQALADLIEAKQLEPMRQAACKAKPAKRTRKPKPKGKTEGD